MGEATKTAEIFLYTEVKICKNMKIKGLICSAFGTSAVLYAQCDDFMFSSEAIKRVSE